MTACILIILNWTFSMQWSLVPVYHVQYYAPVYFHVSTDTSM